MPQIYHHPPRREEEPSPESSDADDEIVLSDLVRTGEASRLRRRGAMRIDHAVREGGGPPPAQSPGSYPSGRDVQANESILDPNAFWRQDQDGADEEYGPPYTGEWPETRDTQTDDLDDPEDLKNSTHTFVLYCGAEEPNLMSSTTPHVISPLPAYPPRPPHSRTFTTSNGCGAVIHTSAIPPRQRGDWMASLGSTDAIIEMDSQYFDRSVVVKMVKSPCGCVREGIGCRFWYVDPRLPILICAERMTPAETLLGRATDHVRLQLKAYSIQQQRQRTLIDHLAQPIGVTRHLLRSCLITSHTHYFQIAFRRFPILT